MGALDYLIVAVTAALFILAVIYIIRRRKKGCIGCCKSCVGCKKAADRSKKAQESEKDKTDRTEG